MTVVSLGDAIELAYGKGLPVRARNGGAVPVYGSNGVVGWHDKAVVSEPTIIVGRKGSVGAIHLASRPSYPIDTTYFVRTRPGIELDMTYASYALKHMDLSRLKTETGVPGLNREDAYREHFPLPSLEEQRRIVGILNRASHIERLRARATDRLQQFIPALFLKMFGDPAANPMGWRSASLGEVCAINPRAEKNLNSDLIVSFVPMASVDGKLGVISSYDERPLLEVSKGFTTFQDGDILFAKITPCMENGKTALVQNLTNGVGRGSTEFHVLRPGNSIIGEYVHCFIRRLEFRERAKQSFTGTAGQQRVPKSFLGNTLIPVPPLDKQRYFAAIVAQAYRTMNKAQAAADTAATLSTSLMDRLLGR